MAVELLLPRLDMTTDEMTIIRWLKGEGEAVRKGEPILEVMTEKVSIEVESPADGVLQGVRHGPDAVVPVGELLAYIAAPGEAPGGTAPAAAAPAAGAPAAAAPAAAAPAGAPAGAVRAAPAVRRLARELGVDIRQVRGSGPSGRVRAEDVQAAAAAREAAARAAAPAPAPAPAAAGGTARPLSATRRVIARRMQSSWQAAPHVTLFMDVDMSAAAPVRLHLRRVLEATGAGMTWNAFIAWVAVQAAVRHGGVSATLEQDTLTRYEGVNLGVAVDAPGGLLVPVVHGADRMRPGELAAALAAAGEKARQARLQPGDVAGGTFTITNLGSFGIGGFTPIINPPQVAILGLGAVADRLVPVDGHPVVRPVCTFSLSIDHRALDGADGARYLALLRDLFQNPYELMV